MAKVTSRESFKDWILKRLGHPVIEINVDDDQVEDRIDEALEFYQLYHYDGTEKVYLKHQITQTDIDNEYIPVSPDVSGISKVFPSYASTSTINMWDIRYQMRLQDIQSFTTGSISNYWITMTHLRMLEMELQGEQPIRFNKNTGKLYVDWDWKKDAVVGQYVIIEASAVVDPDANSAIWNDRMLLLYGYALVKMQWGNNLKKYSGIPLPGNAVTLNGQQIYDEALKEKEDLEDEFKNSFMAVSPFHVG